MAAGAGVAKEKNKLTPEEYKAIVKGKADRKEESTFWFPAIMRGGGLVAGLVSEDGDHGAVKAAAAKIRKILEEEL